MDNCRVIFVRTRDVEPGDDGYVWTIEWIVFLRDGTKRRTNFFTKTLIGYDDDAIITEGKIAASVKQEIAVFVGKAVANTDINYATFTRGK